MIKFTKIKHDVKEYLPRLTPAFEEDKSIIAAYLFGSFAKNRTSSLSDVDLAVLLKDTFPKENYLDKQLEVIAAASRILKTDEVDVVVLNRANPYLAYHILRYSKLLFLRNKKQKVEFQAAVVARYLDTKKIRALNFDKMVKRVKEGTFGQ